MKYAKDFLKQLLKDGDEPRVIDHLQNIPGQVLIEILCQLTKEMSYEIIPFLIKLIQHPVKELQEAARKAIGEITASNEYEFLEQDSKMKVRMQGSCHAKNMGAQLARIAGLPYFNYSEEQIDYLI